VVTLETGSRKMDKQTFINNVREAQKSRPIVPFPNFSDADTVSTTATAGTAKEAFIRNFTKNHGEVFEDTKALIDFLKEKSCKMGVADSMLSNTLGLENEFELSREFDRENKPDAYDFGISKASFAIAESGAIVFKDTDTADRLTTIAPWIHIAVIEESSIVKTIPEALAKTVDCPYAIYVAGPSKTTDVEGVLVEGVHGPGIQIAFLTK